jgi:predicted mannosyl-3-phosphoglycerate phosphatase (HAD superfamily)
MASITFVTPAELSEVVARLDMVEQRLAVHEEFADDEVRTKKALELTGIKSRTTLIEERDRPGTLIRYSKHGRSTSYSRKSCIDYRLARRLAPLPTTPVMRVSA